MVTVLATPPCGFSSLTFVRLIFVGVSQAQPAAAAAAAAAAPSEQYALAQSARGSAPPPSLVSHLLADLPFHSLVSF